MAGLEDGPVLDALANEFALAVQEHVGDGHRDLGLISHDMRRAFRLAGEEIMDAINLGIDRLIASERHPEEHHDQRGTRPA